jgi:hypothetical protein
VQAITGIPNYYRQYGYEMAMTLGGGRIGHKAHVPELKDGESESHRVRPATEDDLGFIAGLYERIADRQPVHCLRDESDWRYELDGRSASSDNSRLLRVIESDGGEPVGFLVHAEWLWGKRMGLTIYELKPDVSWLAVTPGVIRYLWATGEAYAARDGKACEAFEFGLGAEHPVYTAFSGRLPDVRDPYAWYLRVSNLVGFLRHVAPVLERRLAASDAAGYSGEIKVSFYRAGLLLRLEGGRLTEIADWSPAPEDWGNAAFPGLTFLHLLFDYRTCGELWHVFRDCWTDNSEVRAVLDGLFPKRPSHVWPIG